MIRPRNLTQLSSRNFCVKCGLTFLHSGTSAADRIDAFAARFKNGRSWLNRASAEDRFVTLSPVHRAAVKWQLRVESTVQVFRGPRDAALHRPCHDDRIECDFQWCRGHPFFIQVLPCGSSKAQVPLLRCRLVYTSPGTLPGGLSPGPSAAIRLTGTSTPRSSATATLSPTAVGRFGCMTRSRIVCHPENFARSSRSQADLPRLSRRGGTGSLDASWRGHPGSAATLGLAHCRMLASIERASVCECRS